MAQIVILSFCFAFTLSIFFFQLLFRERNRFQERLKKYTTGTTQQKQQEEDDLSKPFAERVIRPGLNLLSGMAARLTPSRNRQKLQQLLQAAGNPGGLKAHEYQAIHYLFIIMAMLGGWSLAWLSKKGLQEQVILPALAGVVAQLAGKAYLSSKARERKNRIQKEFPDAMDLLTVSVEAGLGFDAALMQVAEKSKGALAGEFMVTLQELQMGKSRREALRDLGHRTDVEDINTFVGSMIQSDQLGVSITRVLRTQAEQVRTKRRQRVEEKAMKAPVKMLIPMVFFIFPSIFIVLLGPALIKIYTLYVEKF